MYREDVVPVSRDMSVKLVGGSSKKDILLLGCDEKFPGNSVKTKGDSVARTLFVVALLGFEQISPILIIVAETYLGYNKHCPA